MKKFKVVLIRIGSVLLIFIISLLLVLLIIFSAPVILFSGQPSSGQVARLKECKADLEIISNYLLDYYANNIPENSLHVTCFPETINGRLVLTTSSWENEKEVLELQDYEMQIILDNLHRSHDLDTVSIYSNSVFFIGNEGIDVLIYSKNNKRPKYYFGSADDHNLFYGFKLADHWFYSSMW
jgi:hypothetical protein